MSVRFPRNRIAVLVSAVAAVVVIGIAFWLDGESRRAASANPDRPAMDADASDGALVEAPVGAGDPGDSDAAAERAAVDPAALEGPGDIEGVLQLFDDEGTRLADPTLELDLYHEVPGVATGMIVDVVDGRFGLDLDAGDVVRAEPFVHDGRVAFLEGAPQRVIPAEGPMVLRYRMPPPLRLAVVDARTQQELPAVYVTASCADPRRATGNEILAAGTPSPCALPTLAEDDELWIGSPGYAWREVLIDPRGGGDVVVELERGGALAVAVDAGESTTTWAIEVGPLDDPEHSVARQPVRSGNELLIEDLAPGHYVVRLGGYSFSRLCDWTTARVEAGLTTEIRLAPGTTNARNRIVRVTGLFALPLRMDASTLELAFLPAEDGYRRAEQVITGDEFTVTPEGLLFETTLRTGRYAWSVDALGLRGELMIGSQREQEVHLSVPPLAEVTVRLVDAQPATVAGAYITWMSPVVALPAGLYWNYRDFEGREEMTFLAPIGPLQVDLGTPTHPEVTRHVDVRPGKNEIAIELRPPTGLRVYLHGGSEDSPLDPWYDVIPIGHSGTVIDWGDPDDGANDWIFVDRPGRYRLIVEHQWRYAPVEPIEVELAPGVMARIDVRFRAL